MKQKNVCCDNGAQKEDRMALVACPECKQQVSTEAASCPHCGKQLSGAAPGAYFVPGGPGGPEETLWAGNPSIALAYGKILKLAIRLIVVFVVGYFAISRGLPALGIVDENVTYFELGIVVALAFVVLPSVFGLLQAIARIRNTHYRVSNQ